MLGIVSKSLLEMGNICAMLCSQSCGLGDFSTVAFSDGGNEIEVRISGDGNASLKPVTKLLA